MKNVIFVIVLIVILVVVFFVLPKDEVDEDVSLLLAGLKESTELEFSELQSEDFAWKTTDDDIIGETTVGGHGYSIENLTEDGALAISLFFSGEGFVGNVLNTEVGETFGQIAYNSDTVACMVAGGLLDPSDVEAGSSFDIVCGDISGAEDVEDEAEETETPEDGEGEPDAEAAASPDVEPTPTVDN